jgi:biotin synthase-like enzyme
MINTDFNSLISKAKEIYKSNFPMETHFGRCVFVSWFCERATCKFCYRSTYQHKTKHASNAKRSMSSMIADAIIGKYLGWKFEYLTGGYGVFSFDELAEIAKNISIVYGHKIWVNIGALDEAQMLKLKPYVEGICASIETVEPNLHNSICPDKPIKPYSDMLKLADKLGLKKSITIVIGLGEKKEDINLLFDFIEKHKLDRITFYALKPVKGTIYTSSPEPEDYAWWIAQTRIKFPKLEIIAGLTPKKVDYVELILNAGANAITKFPAVNEFNSKKANLIETLANNAGRRFNGSLTKIPNTDWTSIISKLPFDQKLKDSITLKLSQNLDKMKKKK